MDFTAEVSCKTDLDFTADVCCGPGVAYGQLQDHNRRSISVVYVHDDELFIAHDSLHKNTFLNIFKPKTRSCTSYDYYFDAAVRVVCVL